MTGNDGCGMVVTMYGIIWVQSCSGAVDVKHEDLSWPNDLTTSRFGLPRCGKKQGRIHGYWSRVRVGRGSDENVNQSIWAGAVRQEPPVKLEANGHRPTDQPTMRVIESLARDWKYCPTFLGWVKNKDMWWSLPFCRKWPPLEYGGKIFLYVVIYWLYKIAIITSISIRNMFLRLSLPY